jgi:glycosyltransferase involved in cell wall biosynthesis
MVRRQHVQKAWLIMSPGADAFPGERAPAVNAPLVSVVVPVFNAAPYLEACLESIFGQEYLPIEVIAVDNGSTDGSLEILHSYEPRVRVVRESRKGAAAARNAGIRSTKGSLLAFQDADDVWLPGKLRAQVDYLESHPDVAIVFGQFAAWRSDGSGRYEPVEEVLKHSERWVPRQPLSGWIYADELLACPIAMITPMIRREVVDVVGDFDETLEAGEDYDFWLRATYRFKAHKLDAPVALYRMHGAGTTAGCPARNMRAEVLQRAIDRTGLTGPDGRTVRDDQIRRHFAEIWFDFAMVHLQRGRVAVGLSALKRYVRVEPDRKKGLLTAVRAVPWALRNRTALARGRPV